MTVKGLIEELKTFDENLSVVALSNETQEDFIIIDVIWQNDGKCKILFIED